MNADEYEGDDKTEEVDDEIDGKGMATTNCRNEVTRLERSNENNSMF